LIANAWDAEDCTEVCVTLQYAGKIKLAELVVEDNSPVGFPDLRHAFTLFAHTDKRSNPNVRGRFNLGEKLAIAGAVAAEVHTTSGRVLFEQGRGRRVSKKNCREVGTRVELAVRCTRQEFDDACEMVRACVPDAGQITWLDGHRLRSRQDRAMLPPMEAKALPSVLAGEDGHLRATRRDTTVWLYPYTEQIETGPPWLYEMGIPICRLDDGEPCAVDVMGKIPVDMLKGLVAPRFLRALHVELLNNYHDKLEGNAAFDPKASWVRSAMENPKCSEAAAKTVVRARFGDKVVSYDPSDKEGSNLAVAKGYTVVHGGSMSKQEWATVKRAEALKPAGQVTPGPKVSGVDPTARVLPETEWTLDQTIVVTHVTRLLARLLHGPVEVVLMTGDNLGWTGLWTRYSPARSDYIAQCAFNVTGLGPKWFSWPAQYGMWQKVHDLMLHEAAHQLGLENHLDERYHAELSRLGAKLTKLALREPELFKPTGES